MRWTLGIDDLRQLLADIDEALRVASHNGCVDAQNAWARGFNVGWNGALDKLQQDIESLSEYSDRPQWSLRSIVNTIESVRESVNAIGVEKAESRVPEGATRAAEAPKLDNWVLDRNGLTSEQNVQVEQTLKTYTDYGRRIACLEKQDRLTLECLEEQNRSLQKLLQRVARLEMGERELRGYAQATPTMGLLESRLKPLEQLKNLEGALEALRTLQQRQDERIAEIQRELTLDWVRRQPGQTEANLAAEESRRRLEALRALGQPLP